MAYEEGILIPTNQVNVSNSGEMTPSDLIVDWHEMKYFYTSVSAACMLNYVDIDDGTPHYFIWLKFQDQKMFLPNLVKGTTDAIEFETSYKSKCNIPEWPRNRITTCKAGRKMHNRYITFVTADPGNYDNTNYLDVDYGDVTYTLKDINRQTTTEGSLAKETWIDWEMTNDFEIAGGTFFIPPTLASRNLSITSIAQSGGVATGTCVGHKLRSNCMITISGADPEEYNGVKDILATPDSDTFTFPVSSDTDSPASGTILAVEGDDAWEVHVIAVPDVPSSMGGCIQFIANSRVKWLKGTSMSVESDLNPSEIKYSATYHTSKLRVIVKHPVGVKTEFQFSYRIFK